ncbi:MAG: hypothetical protein AAF628_04570 [Planctomycetota bacterium]
MRDVVSEGQGERLALERRRSELLQAVIEGVALIALIEVAFFSGLGAALLTGLAVGGGLGVLWHVTGSNAGVSALLAVLVVLGRVVATGGPVALLTPMSLAALVLAAAAARLMGQQRQKTRMGI